jgi:hypothetical protein
LRKTTLPNYSLKPEDLGNYFLCREMHYKDHCNSLYLTV